MSSVTHIDSVSPVSAHAETIKRPHFLRKMVLSVKARIEAKRIGRSLKEVASIRAGKKKVITLDEFLETF